MKNILLVEDNSLERRLIEFILKKTYEGQVNIFIACDGNEGLSILSKYRIDLVITDLVMPNVEGIELIRKIKADYPDIQNIIAMSGKNPYYLYLAKKIGVQDVFTKPLDKDKFLKAISKLLGVKYQNPVSFVSQNN